MAEEYRPLVEAEADPYFRMVSQAFQMEASVVTAWRKRTPLETLRGLFVDGQMRAGLTLYAMQMWFGQPVRAGGLGAVATPPEYRRQGYTGRMLHAVLSEIRDAGWPLCVLYPFYFPFYRRYDWAHAADNHRYTIPVERLPLVRDPGSWHPVLLAADPRPEDRAPVADADLAVLLSVYDAWVVGRYGAMPRDATWWRDRKFGPNINLYYWRDAEGTPRAIVQYRFEPIGEWERKLHTTVFALDSLALRAALGFLRNHDSQAAQIVLTAPEDLRLLAVLDDPRIQAEVDPGFMLQIVDIPAALSARGYAAGAVGRLALRVGAGFFHPAPVTYLLDVADGHAQAAPAAAEPDLSLDPRTLGQLYSGYLTPREAAALGLLAIHTPAALERAAAVFAAPRPFLADFF